MYSKVSSLCSFFIVQSLSPAFCPPHYLLNRLSFVFKIGFIVVVIVVVANYQLSENFCRNILKSPPPVGWVLLLK